MVNIIVCKILIGTNESSLLIAGGLAINLGSELKFASRS